MFLRKGEVHTKPRTGILASEMAAGSIVKVNESGAPVEFYLAKHNYEAGLNGEGRTLLVRKDCYDKRAWHGSNINAYETCDIGTWLNSTYKNMLDATTRGMIGSTKFYYTPCNGITTVGTLERPVFLLSMTELGLTPSYANAEGTALEAASSLQIAYLNGAKVNQWTRTPNIQTTTMAYKADTTGGVVNSACTQANGARPAFTVPSNALFDKNTLVLKGVE